jgi:hypothetical protein
MSQEYDYIVGLGFLITEKMVPECYVLYHKKMVKKEPRFDPKTGKPLVPALVTIQKEHNEYKLDSRAYDYFGDFLKAVARRVGGVLYEFGSPNWDIPAYMIEWKGSNCCKRVPQYDENPSVIWYCPMLYVINQYPKYKVMQDKLEKLGFKVGEPMIVLQETVS